VGALDSMLALLFGPRAIKGEFAGEVKKEGVHDRDNACFFTNDAAFLDQARRSRSLTISKQDGITARNGPRPRIK